MYLTFHSFLILHILPLQVECKNIIIVEVPLHLSVYVVVDVLNLHTPFRQYYNFLLSIVKPILKNLRREDQHLIYADVYCFCSSSFNSDIPSFLLLFHFPYKWKFPLWIPPQVWWQWIPSFFPLWMNVFISHCKGHFSWNRILDW